MITHHNTYIFGEYLLCMLFASPLPDDVEIFSSQVRSTTDLRKLFSLHESPTLSVTQEPPTRVLNIDFWKLLPDSAFPISDDERYPIEKKLYTVANHLDEEQTIRLISLALRHPWTDVTPAAHTIAQSLLTDPAHPPLRELYSQKYFGAPFSQLIKSFSRHS